MPAVYDGFVHMGYSPGKSWRLTFIVPLVMVILCGVCLLLFCPDTPTGKWSDRHQHAHEALVIHGVDETAGVVDVPGAITDKAPLDTEKRPASASKDAGLEKKDTITASSLPPTFDHEAQMTKEEMLVTAQGEIVVKPSLSEAIRVAISPQTIFHILTYMNSFGGELAINSILASYYYKNFPNLTQTTAANWAAMFGFLNFVTRPLGGIVSDLLYKYFNHNLWFKKAWIIVCGVITGIMLIIIGRLDPHDQSTMIGLVSLMSIFLEAGNGANFSLVPHVHPYANGILSGLTGAGGNLGGVIFAIIFRFMDGGANYAKAFWVIGCIQLGVSLAVSWIPPLPKGQIGGH
ncbi:major facilitator superfamily domain-containing protein [Immersiella caudata]|uniref:Major facilitator superfamily domain-containing protein n=1 Tax=Immersiella caudata TaxID=314043 RepID=A0AA39XFT7_9PEZI|nr:major facilitator superfamily domain-containing protein [Immersiella caudata]